MPNYPNTPLIKAISKIVTETPLYQWKYLNIYEISVLATITLIKSRRVVIISKLNNFSSSTSKHSPFFKWMTLYFLHTAYEKKTLFLHTNIDSVPLNILRETYIISNKIFFEDVSKKITEESIASYKSLLNLLGDEVMYFCLNFLFIAKEKNLVNDLLEEFYLLREIESIKKLE
jgi:hypothetical protein